MGSFFNLDSPFMKFGNLLADIMILSILWIFFSIPIFTMGASTTALFYVTTKRISNKEGYISKDFWKSFKGDFFKSTIVFLILVVAFGLLIFNFFNADKVFKQMNLHSYLKFGFGVLQFIIGLELTFISIFIFPTLARFDIGLKQLFKNAFFISNRHILTTILCIGLGVVLIFATLYIPILIFITIGGYALLASYLIIRVLKKYRPEIDS